MPDEHTAPQALPVRPWSDGLHMGPRKKNSTADPLVSYGRHFGRTVHALANVKALITNGILRLGELADEPDESFTAEQRREHRVFQKLLQMVPGLEERIMNGNDEDVMEISEHLQKGLSSARADDTKGLKGAILEWIAPPGQSLVPPIARNIKMDRGFNHDRTGSLLCPAGMDWTDPELKAALKSGEMQVPGDQWPLFIYARCEYDPDDAWKGAFRNTILVAAYKYIFTSPSSVDKICKATRSGNARIHGMTNVTLASIAYIATQVRFALSSSAVFSRTDTTTDSERFYDSIIEMFEDPEEQHEVNDLLVWWNRQIFPQYSSAKRPPPKNSALTKIRERRERKKKAAVATAQTISAITSSVEGGSSRLL